MGSCCCGASDNESKVQAAAATGQGSSAGKKSQPEQIKGCGLLQDFKLLMSKVNFASWLRYNPGLAAPSCMTTANQTEIQSNPNVMVRFRDQASCTGGELFSDSREGRVAAFKKTHLGRDQELPCTSMNEPVTQAVTNCLLTESVLSQSRANPDELSGQVKVIIFPPYTTLNMIVPGVYLTGFYGMVDQRLNQESIKLIINVSNEIPLYKGWKITAIRVPVVDSRDEAIGQYFDDVADVIESARRHEANTVVHCMAGVSRSATLILAYLIKYTDMSLYEAFVYTKLCRPCIRPNMGFFRQLIEHERKLNGKTSVHMAEFTDEATQRRATVPNFYVDQFPELFQIELERQNKSRA